MRRFGRKEENKRTFPVVNRESTAGEAKNSEKRKATDAESPPTPVHARGGREERERRRQRERESQEGHLGIFKTSRKKKHEQRETRTCNGKGVFQRRFLRTGR